MLLLEISLCSGGEQHRVSFAVSLIQQPPLLILDEPTVGMDTLLWQRFSLYYIQSDMEQSSICLSALNHCL